MKLKFEVGDRVILQAWAGNVEDCSFIEEMRPLVGSEVTLAEVDDSCADIDEWRWPFSAMIPAQAVATTAKKERRERIATKLLAGLFANPSLHSQIGTRHLNDSSLVDITLEAADILIARLDA